MRNKTIDEKFEVGSGATWILWTDRQAGTVIEVSNSGKKMKIQLDKATLLNGPNSGEADALTVDVGGFAAHVEGKQRWAYERDEEGRVIEASIRKNGKWKLKGCGTHEQGNTVIAGRHAYYDHNF